MSATLYQAAFGAFVGAASAFVFGWILLHKQHRLNKEISEIRERAEKARTRRETFRAIKDAFNSLNALAVNNDDYLKAIDDIMRPNNTSETIQQKRELYVAYTVYNVLEMIYLERERGSIDVDYADRTLRTLLPLVIQRDDLFNHFRETGYSPAFIKYCEKCKRKTAQNG